MYYIFIYILSFNVYYFLILKNVNNNELIIHITFLYFKCKNIYLKIKT